MEIVAHRGDSTEATANTIPAFQRALDLGADAIEYDVRLTRDGVPVISNALSFVGAVSLHAPIFSYTLEEIRADARYEIPTLRDILDRFGGHIGLELHLKVDELQSVHVVAQELQPLESLWKSIEVTSYDPISLDVIGRHCPGLATDLLLPLTEPRMTPHDIATLAIYRAAIARSRGKHRRVDRVRAIHLHPTQLVSETVTAIRAAGFDVHAWGVNDAQAREIVKALAIPRICTDRLVDALASRRRHTPVDR